MQTEWIRRNTGSPSGDHSWDQLATRESQAGPYGVAERSVLPMKPGTFHSPIGVRHTVAEYSMALVPLVLAVEMDGSDRSPAAACRSSAHPLSKWEERTEPSTRLGFVWLNVVALQH